MGALRCPLLESKEPKTRMPPGAVSAGAASRFGLVVGACERLRTTTGDGLYLV